jgi:Na+-transporting methylmalonyl-CoA/oxaloacetate decarboxylase gamma subunit
MTIRKNVNKLLELRKKARLGNEKQIIHVATECRGITMKRYKFGFSLILWIGMSMSSFSQHIGDLRINEMLINNKENYADEYGRHVPWVEIFNSAYNSVNVGECYLTDDTTGLTDGSGMKNWYRIPKSDPKTLIPQQSFVVFYMDNAPLYGTFHVNFDPRNSKTNYVALISSNGRTLIDIFHYPEELRTDSIHSYGCRHDGMKNITDKKGKVHGDLAFLDYFTPGSTNFVDEDKTKSEIIAEKDPYGIGIAIISISVVFSVLAIIFILLKLFTKLNNRLTAINKKRSQKIVHNENVSENERKIVKQEKEECDGETIAAIMLALHLHFTGLHDEESEIITIETSSAHYSPWAQKHLIFKQTPRRN